MKKTLIASLATVGLFSGASAYTVSFLNIGAANETAVPILDNTGTPIALGSGYVATGTFSALPTGVADVKANFTAFGDGTTDFSNGLSAPGFFNKTRSASIPAGTTDAPVGQNVYLVIGDGPTLADSTDFVVFDPSAVFGTENAVGAGGIDININSDAVTPDSVLWGTIVNNVDTGLGVTFTEGLQIGNTVVPEPSTSLLAALAGLALAARRRR
ncbi:MAG: PEP-CTERM sorting domain-containing protein [Akkermansiaceae bacterium]